MAKEKAKKANGFSDNDKKRSFVLYYDYRKHLQILDDAERGKLLMALMDYGESGKEPELDGATLMAFSFIALQMDKDAERYAKTCENRREAGKKGGRPPKNKEESEAPEEEPEPPKKAEKAKKANGFSEKQSKAKKGDNDNDNDNDNDIDLYLYQDINPLPPLTPPGNNAPDGAEEEEEDATVPYVLIVDLYHDICKSFPKLRRISNIRKAAISECWHAFGESIDVFRELFELVEASRFLKGEREDGNGWSATFDWLMIPQNFGNVLEGNYYDKETTEASSGFWTDHMNATLKRWEEREDPKTAADDIDIKAKADELRQRLAK